MRRELRELQTFVRGRIAHQAQTIIGYALSGPYLYSIGGQTAWVIDVVVKQNAQHLAAVPLAEGGRSVRDFINKGAPLEMRRDKGGQFYVIGFADRLRATVQRKTYARLSAGMAFADGWRYDSVGSVETGNGNDAPTGTPETITYTYTTTPVVYGSLNYGITPYGAVTVTRTP